MLTYAVQEAYHALLPGGRHPLAAIHLTVPPDDLDVNVHPTKIEVRFRHDRRVFSLLRRALRQALAAFAPVPALQPQAIGVPAPGAGGSSGSGSGTAPGLGALTPADLAAALAYDAPATGAGQPVLVSAPAAPPPRDATETGRGRPGGGLRALGQIGLTYIVAEDASGLYLIDQHSAHERVVYEQLLKEDRQSDAAAGTTGASGGPAAQLLLAPETVDLNAAQEAWLQEHAPTLQRFGFQIEPFGGHTWLMRAVPRSLVARGRARALGELIDNLIEREYGDGPLDDQARWAIACHSAVRAGDRLAAEEMAALIAQLERCDMRRTCPHGRPTMIHLSHAQLEREFGRR
jgi:DNA mismatch repair protein MutL